MDETFAIDVLGHPPLERRYFYEYEKLLKNDVIGIPYFQKSFIADDFCSVDKDNNLIKYVDFLISSSQNRRPIFQFCRSSLRVDWFFHQYSSSYNLYIVRNPRDNWASYVTCSQNGNSYFLVMNLMFAALNIDNRHMDKLAKVIPMVNYLNNDFRKEFKAYKHLLDAYSLEETYFIFYYVWFLSLVKNTLYSNFIINISKLNEDFNYRKKVSTFLSSIGINNINFSDVNIKKYPRYPIPDIKMEKIENNVHRLVLSIYDIDTSTFLKMLPMNDLEHLGLEQLRPVIKTKPEKSFSNEMQNDARKYKEISELLLKNIIKLDDKIEDRENRIQQIYSSLPWRLLAPVRRAKHFAKKIICIISTYTNIAPR